MAWYKGRLAHCLLDVVDTDIRYDRLGFDESAVDGADGAFLLSVVARNGSPGGGIAGRILLDSYGLTSLPLGTDRSAGDRPSDHMVRADRRI